MTYHQPTVLAWRAAAAAAFSATLAEALGMPKSRLQVEVVTHPTTAAVSWVHDTYNNTMAVTLYLPKMDLTGFLTRAQADILAGYWLHEAGHVLYTPADGMKRNAHRGQGFTRLINGLEDVRMEGKILAGSPASNARSTLIAITKHVALKGTSMQDPIGNANVWHDLPWTVAYLGRAHCHGYPLGQHLLDYRATLNPVNHGHMVEILRRLALASTFEDIEALALWIWMEVYPSWDHPQQQQPQQQGDQPQPGEGGEGQPGQGQPQPGQPQPGEGEGEGEGEGDTPGEAPGEGAQGQSEGEGPEGQPQTSSPSSPPPNGSSGKGSVPDRDDMGSAEPDVSDIADDLNKGLPEGELERQYGRYSGNLTAADAHVSRSPRSDRPQSYNKLRDAFDGVHAIRAQVRRLFEAPEHFGHDRRKEKGRFDPQAAVRASWGARDVFAITEEAPGYSTAVEVMLDGSDSMDGPYIRAALGMAAQISEVAQSRSCPVQVDVFQRGWGRQLNIRRVLPFGARIDPDARVRFGSATHCGGGTPLAAGVVHGSMSLDTRDEPRRLLVVLTDGSNDEGPAPVAQAVAAARKRGIAVVALGLGVTGRDKVNFDEAFAEADARATSDSAHLASAALKAIADALARHQWGMVTRRAA